MRSKKNESVQCPLHDEIARLTEHKDHPIKKAKIKGTQLHETHKDPTDPQKVISIQFLDDKDSRVGTGHLHEDGTSKVRYYQKEPGESASQGFE